MTTKPKRPRDVNQLAKLIVDLSVGNAEDQDPNVGKNMRKVESGRKGGLHGGKVRTTKMSNDELSSAARKAALKRWAKD